MTPFGPGDQPSNDSKNAMQHKLGTNSNSSSNNNNNKNNVSRSGKG